MFGHENEPVTLTRDVRAIIVPIGEAITLDQGTEGFITQALGGSFTVYIEGNLFRISGVDADALGKEPVEPPSVPDNATDADIESVARRVQAEVAGPWFARVQGRRRQKGAR